MSQISTTEKSFQQRQHIDITGSHPTHTNKTLSLDVTQGSKGQKHIHQILDNAQKDGLQLVQLVKLSLHNAFKGYRLFQLDAKFDKVADKLMEDGCQPKLVAYPGPPGAVRQA